MRRSQFNATGRPVIRSFEALLSRQSEIYAWVPSPARKGSVPLPFGWSVRGEAGPPPKARAPASSFSRRWAGPSQRCRVLVALPSFLVAKNRVPFSIRPESLVISIMPTSCAYSQGPVDQPGTLTIYGFTGNALCRSGRLWWRSNKIANAVVAPCSWFPNRILAAGLPVKSPSESISRGPI